MASPDPRSAHYNPIDIKTPKGKGRCAVTFNFDDSPPLNARIIITVAPDINLQGQELRMIFDAKSLRPVAINTELDDMLHQSLAYDSQPDALPKEFIETSAGYPIARVIPVRRIEYPLDGSSPKETMVMQPMEEYAATFAPLYDVLRKAIGRYKDNQPNLAAEMGKNLEKCVAELGLIQPSRKRPSSQLPNAR